MCKFYKCPTYLWSPELIASSSLLRRSALGPPPLPGPTSRDLKELLTRGLVAWSGLSADVFWFSVCPLMSGSEGEGWRGPGWRNVSVFS